MSDGIITLTTDFGTGSPYIAQMKGVMLGINPDLQIVDITHSIARQNAADASMVLDRAIDAFPQGTIHLVVVDPGVGSDRSMVAVEMGGWRFVGPSEHPARGGGTVSATLYAERNTGRSGFPCYFWHRGQ